MAELDRKARELDEWEASIKAKEAMIDQAKFDGGDASVASSTQNMEVPKEPSIPLNQN